MNNQMTQRDYELISAYLDGQLSGKERFQFEARLKTDPLLQKELHEIGKTRLLIRNLPKLRAPRNFFVSSKVISKGKVQPLPARRSFRLAPSMGIVSAIATILFTLIIFGDKLLSTSGPVALAPALQAPQVTIVVQEQAQSKISPSETPSEAAPMVMMAAPVSSSPTVPASVSGVGQSINPTPTTIYLNVYPPSATPEGRKSASAQQTETAIECGVLPGDSISPTEPGLNCPATSGTASIQLESLSATSTPSPGITGTPIQTGTVAQNIQVSETPTLTATPTVLLTPSPSPTPLVSPYEASPFTLQAVPTEVSGSGADISASNQAQVAETPTPVGRSIEVTSTTPNISFMRYILLAVEVSLAVIAVIAGIAAIILRIRAGR